MNAWRRWYHVNGNTYGTWLRGDRRGWRARHHREHVEGDYRNPPPAGTYEKLHSHSKQLLKGLPVYLGADQRQLAGRTFVSRLLRVAAVEVIALALDSCHYHLLGRFPDGDVRRPVGLAKRAASIALGPAGLPGTVWAKRCRALPIRDRSHQKNVFAYIAEHANQGAWVWTFRDPVPDAE